MTFTFRDDHFSEEEFNELKMVIGEFRRICRDQCHNNSEHSLKKLSIAESILSKLHDVEVKNTHIK